MNAIRCPNCQATNQTSALQCHQCGMPFANLPSSAYVSVPVEQTYEAQAFGFAPPPVPLLVPEDNETGRKTFFWYRVYCGVLAALYVLVAALGFFLYASAPSSSEYTAEEVQIMGVIYAALGVALFLVFAVAFFLPRRPYNWIVGIIMMAIGMSSCCFLPFLIPLLIFWVKPETKAHFGRN